ncbi:rubredoxin [Candidatus Aerophobetes bacterium]|nr:rubredoxin [Candidatus Aerophobetes bacterium]
MDLKALYRISYGLYVISSRKKGKLNGQIANTLFQLTSEPPTVAVSINKENLTHQFIDESRVFAASILSENTPLKFIGHFGFKSGREIDKLIAVNYKIGKTKAPVILDNTLAYLEAEVIKKIDVGTHTIFIGKVVEVENIKEGIPMTYAYYHEVKQGKAPKTAPTYIKEEPKKRGRDKYRCTVCGYVYDPEKGDPDSGIKPGTSFEELPDDWICPICGAGKEEFEKET